MTSVLLNSVHNAAAAAKILATAAVCRRCRRRKYRLIRHRCRRGHRHVVTGSSGGRAAVQAPDDGVAGRGPGRAGCLAPAAERRRNRASRPSVHSRGDSGELSPPTKRAYNLCLISCSAALTAGFRRHLAGCGDGRATGAEAAAVGPSSSAGRRRSPSTKL